MTARESFLKRVRQAVADGNRAGTTAAAPERGNVGYQGAGADPVARFCDELSNAGGFPHLASSREAAWQAIEGVLRATAARKVLLGRHGMIEHLGIASELRREQLDVMTMDLLGPAPRDAFFAADVGITNVAYLVAETGSVVMTTASDEPRSPSLLPPVHIAIAGRQQLLPDLFDLFDLFSPIATPNKLPPSCMTLITGPSKTGDIELRLVTGVHGPGEIHVVVCVW
jgi:L-lactate utilization protein LutC